MLADPHKTVETIKEIGKKFKGKNASQIVDQLFGKKDDDGSNAKTKEKAKELLNKFLGKEQEQTDGGFVIATAFCAPSNALRLAAHERSSRSKNSSIKSR